MSRKSRRRSRIGCARHHGRDHALKVAAIDDLYIAVGNGNLVARDVVHAAYPELRRASRGPRMIPPMLPPGKAPARHDFDTPVSGLMPGMEFTFAVCCHPVPGDEIVGIVTHRHHYPRTRLPDPDGFCRHAGAVIDVDWNYEVVGKTGAAKGCGHTARISVLAANEPTALADISNAIDANEGVVVNQVIVNRSSDFREVLIDVNVRDIDHLSKVVAGLRGRKTVEGVERIMGA
jgi:guanosine-3',5'-bis(diphosphate) 3'-pyrophosphohydrolase